MSLQAENLSLGSRIKGVSAGFAAGRITAICGPNGAGKSTLLCALAGLLTPDRGQVRLDGEPLLSMEPRIRAQRLGYLPQNGEAVWDVAVRGVVALGRLPYRDDNSRAVASAMKAFDLEGLAERPVSTLSGGERARVFLARVLAGEPEWILADEPLAALDIGHQQSLIGHLRRVAASGVGIAIVLHDLALAMNHADRILVLGQGNLVADDTNENALDPQIIKRVWGVDSEWAGKAGGRALVMRPPGF